MAITLPRFSAPASFAPRRSFQTYLQFTFMLIILLGFVSEEQVKADVSSYYSTEEGRNCVCRFDDEEDYFPIKVSPTFATGFQVEYFKHYKVITSGSGDSAIKYYAYLCGTPVPEVPEGGIPVMIPLRNVGVTSTTFLPFLDYIRQGPTVSFALSQASALPAACHKKRASEGKLGTLTSYGALDETHLKDHNLDAVFLDSWTHPQAVELIDAQCATTHPIKVNSDVETNPLATAEWVEFVAAFFNREEAAQNVAENIELRYSCTKELIAAEKLATTPKVFWFSFWAGTWYAGSCPSYYCQFINDAGGELIQPNGTTSLNSTEVLKLPLDQVDVIMYNGDFDDLVSLNDTGVNTFISAFKEDVKIFSTSKHTTSAWFSSRPAEPDVAFLDIASILQPQISLNHTRYYMRQHGQDVVDPIITYEASECPDETEPLFTNWKQSGCGSELAVIPGLEIPAPTCPMPEDDEIVGCDQGSTSAPPASTAASHGLLVTAFAVAFASGSLLA